MKVKEESNECYRRRMEGRRVQVGENEKRTERNGKREREREEEREGKEHL